MNTNSITSLPLSEKDKENLQSLINIGIRLAKKLRVTMILCFALALLVFFSNGFIQGCIIALIIILLPIFLLFNSYYKIYLDLKSGTKARYILSHYEIIRSKKDLTLKSKELKLDLSHDEDIIPYINLKQPIIIEITKHSKTLLFLSHNETNLLD